MMLFLFLALPLLIRAQNNEYDAAFKISIPDSAGRPIHMPVRDYSTYSNFDYSVSKGYGGKVFIVRSDSIYRKFFYRYTYTDDSLKKYSHLEKENPWLYSWYEKHHVDSVPVIDFSKNELLVYANCPQCLAVCKRNAGIGPCHRNVCLFREAWFIRELKPVTSLQPVMRNNLVDFLLGDTDVDTIPGGNGKWVSLPDISLSDVKKFFTRGHQSSLYFVVDTDSLYHKIFSKYPISSLPVFDFIKQQLLVRFSCYYCLAAGLLNGKPRHRNSCAYTVIWTTRDKIVINKGSAPQDIL